MPSPTQLDIFTKDLMRAAKLAGRFNFHSQKAPREQARRTLEDALHTTAEASNYLGEKDQNLLFIAEGSINVAIDTAHCLKWANEVSAADSIAGEQNISIPHAKAKNLKVIRRNFGLASDKQAVRLAVTFYETLNDLAWRGNGCFFGPKDGDLKKFKGWVPPKHQP